MGPRTLDVDLIMVGNAIVDQEDLGCRIRSRYRTRVCAGALVRGRSDRGAAGKGAIGDLLSKADASGVVRRDDLVIDRD